MADNSSIIHAAMASKPLRASPHSAKFDSEDPTRPLYLP